MTLSIRDLQVAIADDDDREVLVADRVSLEVRPGETVALAGESGAGKSMVALAVVGLLPPRARILSGSIELDGRELSGARERALRKVRGREIGVVFQDPLAALNPVYTIGWQIAEAVRLTRGLGRSESRRQAVELLARVGFPQPEARAGDYPHELSGGMRQRVMIAIALAGGPKLLVADEPTTALDMLAASQIHGLLRDLQREREMGMLLVSHDLLRLGQVSDRLAVMYAGEVVESGPTEEVLASPRHPYTRGLLASVPPLRLQRRRRGRDPSRLPVITGAPPLPGTMPRGCRFHPRCPDAIDRCREEPPIDLFPASEGVEVRCVLHEPGSSARGGAA